MKKGVIPILLAIVLIMIGLIIYFVFFGGKDYSDFESISDNYYIEDRTESCAEALEEIYKDDEYIYYLSCIKSESIFIINKKTKKEYTLKYAMENELVSIDELQKTTVAVMADPIVTIKKVVTILTNNINFREDHSVNASKISDYQLNKDEEYDVLDTYVGDDYTWYKIVYKEETGWFADNGEWASVKEVEID